MTMTIAIKEIQENWKDNLIVIVCMWYTALFVHNKSC